MRLFLWFVEFVLVVEGRVVWRGYSVWVVVSRKTRRFGVGSSKGVEGRKD